MDDHGPELARQRRTANPKVITVQPDSSNVRIWLGDGTGDFTAGQVRMRTSLAFHARRTSLARAELELELQPAGTRRQEQDSGMIRFSPKKRNQNVMRMR